MSLPTYPGDDIFSRSFDRRGDPIYLLNKNSVQRPDPIYTPDTPVWDASNKRYVKESFKEDDKKSMPVTASVTTASHHGITVTFHQMVLFVLLITIACLMGLTFEVARLRAKIEALNK
jgi:hypothetical protein